MTPLFASIGHIEGSWSITYSTPTDIVHVLSAFTGLNLKGHEAEGIPVIRFDKSSKEAIDRMLSLPYTARPKEMCSLFSDTLGNFFDTLREIGMVVEC